MKRMFENIAAVSILAIITTTCLATNLPASKSPNKISITKSPQQKEAEKLDAIANHYWDTENEDHDYIKAVEYYQQAAEIGSLSAYRHLGIAYKNGYGVTQNYEEALKWFLKGANRGDETAQLLLAWTYEKGEGVPKDINVALKWYMKSAEKGTELAQVALARLYEKGDGVPQDKYKSFYWYRKLAERGNTSEQFIVAYKYDKGDGVTQNKTEAAKWYQKAAAGGDSKAQIRIAWMYEKGIGVRKDPKKAVVWFRKAAEADESEAQFALGYRLFRGKGTPANPNEGVLWIKKASDQGLAEAQLFLAIIYLNGDEVLKSTSASMEYYYKAGISFIKKGDRDTALVCLDRMNEYDPGNPLASKLQLTIDSGEPNDKDNDRNKNTPTPSPLESESQQEIIHTGTGWFILGGYIVTAAHVVQGSETFGARLQDGTSVKLEIESVDSVNDLAVMKISQGTKFPPGIPLAQDRSKAGNQVFTLGYPHADVMGTKIKLASGQISSETGAHDDPRYMQVTVPTQGGNSGGPLLNMKGEVVGILLSKLNALKMEKLSGDLTENVNYAIKVAYIAPLTSALRDPRVSGTLPTTQDSLENLVERIKGSVVLVFAR
jgi:TPR repeat protein